MKARKCLWHCPTNSPQGLKEGWKEVCFDLDLLLFNYSTLLCESMNSEKARERSYGRDLLQFHNSAFVASQAVHFEKLLHIVLD